MNNPKSSYSSYEQDLDHIMFDSERIVLFNNLHKINLLSLRNVEIFIAKPNVSVSKYLCEFFKNCNLYI